jgi:amino acid transporter
VDGCIGSGTNWVTFLRAYFSCAIGISTPLVAIASRMAFWIPSSKISPAVWISIYMVPPMVFNFFNVRRYGEIEFWLTSIKTLTCVGLIVLGILLPMNASPIQPLLGTVGNNELVVCTDPTNGNCVPVPGFDCDYLFFPH